MIRPSNTLTLVLIAIALLAIHVPQQAEAGIEVVDRELVSKQRVSSTVYEYSFRLSVEVDGPALDDVRVFVRCDSPVATVVTEGTQPGVGRVDFGDIPGNATTVSTDTFTLRLEGQSREARFDPDCLDYDIGFTETLIISGVATDMPLSGALIIGTITRPDSGRPVIVDSGRPVIESFETTAAADGSYELEMEVISGSDFVTLEAQGTGEQSEAVLTSTVGSVDSLHNVGAEGSIIVTNEETGALDITHITTALDELVRRLNGGVLPATDGELAALQAQVDGAELLELATLIKTIVDNPNVPLPPGFNNTLELIQNPAAAAAALEDIQANFPIEYQVALEETAATLNLGFDEAEVIGTTYLVKAGEVPLKGTGITFNLDPNFGGTAIELYGTVSVIWQIDSEGNLVADVIDPILFESFLARPPTPGQVRALSGITRYTIIRIADGIESDQVLLLTRTTTTFPDNPGIPDETFDTGPGPDAVHLALREAAIIPIEQTDIAGNTIALYHYHQDNDGSGLNESIPQLGADFLTFDPNGTGTTARRGFDFVWSIDGDGALLVEFDNDDSNRYLLYDDSDVSKSVVLASLASGQTGSAAAESIEFAGTSFSEANIVNRRYRALFSVIEQEFQFDFVFLPNGEGCRQIGTPRRMTWEITPDGIVNTSLFFDNQGPVEIQRRSFDLIDVFPGALGDRHWLLETLVFGQPLPDVTTIPGRINAYEFIEDVTGQANPCGFTQNSLGTIFDSDNGGVGNLFDLTPLSTSTLNITGFDINVALQAGTDFEVSVYTTSGGFFNTVTPNVPNCPLFGECIDTSLWSLHSTVQATSAGQDNPTFVDIPGFTLLPGETTGVWITLARDGTIVDEMRYTNGVGPVIFQSAELEISTDGGVTYGPPDRVFLNRIWNGTVYYELF